MASPDLQTKNKTSVGLETPAETLARAQSMMMPSANLPEVTGQDLVDAPEPVDLADTFAAPKFSSNDNVIKNVSNSIVERETAFNEAQKAASEQEATFSALGVPLADERAKLTDQFGVDENLSELKDINLQLADMQTQSKLTQSRISGAAGQTLGQAGREVSQEQREFAIRSAGLAARAAVLQGNIQTARTLINDAMNDLYADRDVQLKVAEKQLNRAYDVADEKERQLLNEQQRLIDEEKARIQEVKDAVQIAVQSGATQEEIARMTSDSVSDEEKLATAYQVIGYGARVDKELERSAKRASIQQGWARIDLEERKFTYEQQRQELEDELEAQKLTGEQKEDQKKVEQALQLKDLTQQIRGHAGFNLSVGSPGSRVFSFTEGGAAGQLWNWLSGRGEGFDALYDQLQNNLTVDNLDKMSGVLSETDIQILSSAASRLRKTTTEKEFLSVLDEMESVFDRTIEEKGVTPGQAKFYFGLDESTLNEVDMIWSGTSTDDSPINFDY